MGLCQPWVTGPEILRRPGMDGVGEDVASAAATEASDFLFVLSGRKFPGTCEAVVRPAARPSSWTEERWATELASFGFPMGFSTTWGVCRIAHNDFGSCNMGRVIDLINTPVIKVSEVLINGEVLGTDAYRVEADKLIRQDGGYWPTCQQLWKPSTATGTFQVTYAYGEQPPEYGVQAATTLGAELAKYHTGKPHKLPSRVTSVVRQDVTVAVLDPMQFIGRKGDLPLTGIWEIDLFIRTANPHAHTVPPAVMSPDRPSGRTVYRAPST